MAARPRAGNCTHMSPYDSASEHRQCAITKNEGGLPSGALLVVLLVEIQPGDVQQADVEDAGGVGRDARPAGRAGETLGKCEVTGDVNAADASHLHAKQPLVQPLHDLAGANANVVRLAALVRAGKHLAGWRHGRVVHRDLIACRRAGALALLDVLVLQAGGILDNRDVVKRAHALCVADHLLLEGHVADGGRGGGDAQRRCRCQQPGAEDGPPGQHVSVARTLSRTHHARAHASFPGLSSGLSVAGGQGGSSCAKEGGGRHRADCDSTQVGLWNRRGERRRTRGY
mmetsp:Transcript_15461/g.38615  ORF Transcript_15461/g.38615 Transcript_15461/m.38615 type:complete len:286 (-) Transcript_15461:102-959(-)